MTESTVSTIAVTYPYGSVIAYSMYGLVVGDVTSLIEVTPFIGIPNNVVNTSTQII